MVHASGDVYPELCMVVIHNLVLERVSTDGLWICKVAKDIMSDNAWIFDPSYRSWAIPSIGKSILSFHCTL